MTRPLRPRTRLLHAGRPDRGWVNAPVTRGSTFVFDDVEHWRDARAWRETDRVLSYGALGTDSTHALEDALVELEGGHRAAIYPTGQAAIVAVMLAMLKAGDHVLVSDAVYEPARRFCTGLLARLGIIHDFYRADGSDIAAKICPQTRLIYAECPGSLVFEMIDLPALVTLARRHGCRVAVDNTWGAGVIYNPLQLGADISVFAATKYLDGHSDVMMGAAVANAETWSALQAASVGLGQTVGADDAFLVLRGIRSLRVRLAAHERNAMKVAFWLKSRPEVVGVHCPALPEHPGHALWKRDCRGTNGLLSVEFVAGIGAADVDRIVNSLELFEVGASWGGFVSLAVPINKKAATSLSDWSARGEFMRLHVGLGEVDDLIADLEQAFDRVLNERRLGAARRPAGTGP
jgi:cysteine-S-conjugate beta-lyase